MAEYKIRIEDIPEQYADIVELLGLEQFLSLCLLCGGCAIYFPRIESLAMDARDREIYKNFTGYNYRQLSAQYRLCERQIRKIIDKQKDLAKGGE